MQLASDDICYSSMPEMSGSILNDDSLARAIEVILAENRRVLKQTAREAIERLAQAITTASRIFVFGSGRSGLVMQMTAMRLMHLGCQIYVVGETVTPAIAASDLLIVCSGSVNTGSVCAIAAKAKNVGANIVLITTNKTSPLGAIADDAIELAAATKHERAGSRSQQFGGSLFEQSTLLLFDALFHVLAQTLDKSTEDLLALHTNLE